MAVLPVPPAPALPSDVVCSDHLLCELPAAIPTVRRPSSREAILDAAEAIVLTQGAAHLTLDAVAEQAGVSKGGLLYNFHTKEILLQAMVDRHMYRIEEARIRAIDQLPPGPGRELKACVRMAGDPAMDGERRLGTAALAARANNPRMLEPVRAAQQRRLEWIRGGESAELPFARSVIIALAVDGLCLLEVLQISPYSDAQRQCIVDDLLRLVDETAAVAGKCAPEPSAPAFAE